MGLRSRVPSRVYGWLGLVYAVGGAIISVAVSWEQLAWARGGLLIAFAVVGGACYLIAFFGHDRGRNTLVLAVAAAAGLTMHGLHPYTGMGIIFVVPWLAAFRTRWWQAASIGLVDAAGLFVVSVNLDLRDGAAIGVSAGLAYFALIAVLVRQLVAAREQSEAVAEARAREAVLGERARLAREMHDILAHSLSGQIVHLEGARLLLERGGDQAAALDRVARAGHLARAGLDETRRALDTLRGDDLRLVERLELLAVEFRTATGARCAVTVCGDPAHVTPEAGLAVVRTAQEALTNVRKHAPGAQVTLTLRCRDGWCELDVQDTGGPPGELTDLGGGYGLVGMRERAELLGGSLEAGGNGTGFGVLLRVPT